MCIFTIIFSRKYLFFCYYVLTVIFYYVILFMDFSRSLQRKSVFMKAYSSEPVPLLRSYPDQGLTKTQMLLIILCLALLTAGITFTWAPIEFDNIYARDSLVQAPFTFLLAVLICIAIFPIRSWQRKQAWREAFRANNADLSIDWTARELVTPLMRKMNLPREVNFHRVAVTLAAHMREPMREPNELSSEVLRHYRRLCAARLPATSSRMQRT